MRFTGVELVRVELDFSGQIGTASGVHRVRPVLYVRVGRRRVGGWGECAALGDATAVDPALGEVEEVAVDRAVPRLCAAERGQTRTTARAAEMAQLFGTSPADRMLAAAFEMAVADAELRAEGRSLAASLGTGAGFEALPVGAVVGYPGRA